jgi:hypothetical protein
VGGENQLLVPSSPHELFARFEEEIFLRLFFHLVCFSIFLTECTSEFLRLFPCEKLFLLPPVLWFEIVTQTRRGRTLDGLLSPFLLFPFGCHHQVTIKTLKKKKLEEAVLPSSSNVYTEADVKVHYLSSLETLHNSSVSADCSVFLRSSAEHDFGL